MKRLTVVLLAFGLAGVGVAQDTNPLPLGQRPDAIAMTVDEAVSRAMDSNPEIEAVVRRLRLAQMKTATARSLDDPMLMVRDWGTPLRAPWDLNQTQLMVGLQRTFPARAKRDARAQVAVDEVAIATEELETVRQRVASEVRRLCADLKRNQAQMRLQGRQVAALRQALDGMLASYTTGKATQLEVLRAQMALTRLSESQIELEEARQKAEAGLNGLLGERPERPVSLTGEYRLPGRLPTVETLEALALEHRPELAALRKTLTRSRDESRLTHMDLKPDFTVAAGLMLMPSGSFARVGTMGELTMSLPQWNQQRHAGEMRQAEGASAVAEAEVESRRTAVFAEVRMAEVELAAAQRRIQLYRDTLLPEAEAQFRAATVAYQNNRGEFQPMVEGESLLLEVEDSLNKAQAAADAAVAELERAIGGPVPFIADAEKESK